MVLEDKDIFIRFECFILLDGLNNIRTENVQILQYYTLSARIVVEVFEF